MIIGITGSYRAGKGTVAEYLVSQKGFKHYSISGYIIEQLQKEGIAADNRDILIKKANEIRTKFGADYIVKELFKRAENESNNAIIESIRCPAEAIFIKKQKESLLIAVDAHPHIRYQRALAVGGIKDKITFKEFIQSEQREFYSNDPNAQNIRACIEMSDIQIINNLKPHDLYKKIEGVISAIENRGKERRY